MVLSEVEEGREAKSDSEGGIGAIRAVFEPTNTSRQLPKTDQIYTERQVANLRRRLHSSRMLLPSPSSSN